MLECGISNGNVATYVSVLQISQTALMLALSGVIEKIKNVLRASLFALLSFVIVFAAMLLVCFNPSFSPDVKYIILFAGGFAVNVALGFYNILSYKIPHHIMSIKDYGWITGISGIFSCVIGAAFSYLLGYFTKKYPYFSAMSAFVIFGIIITLSLTVIFKNFKRLTPSQSKKSEGSVNIFRYKPFYQLLAPNVLRGVSFGIYNLIAVIGFDAGIIDSAGAAILVSVSQIASIISYQIYIPFATHSKNGILCLVSCICFAVSLPFMMSGTLAFYVFYFISFLFVNFINVTIPTIVAQHIEYRCLGQYTAWRMGLYTLGIAVGSGLVPFLLRFGGVVTLAICGVAMIPCGLGYFIFEKKQAL